MNAMEEMKVLYKEYRALAEKLEKMGASRAALAVEAQAFKLLEKIEEAA